MAGGRDRLRTPGIEVALGQGRVARPGQIGAGDAAAAPDHLRVLLAGPPFVGGEVVPVAAPEQVRSLDVLGIAGRVHAGVHQLDARPDRRQRLAVELPQPDRTMPVVAHRAVRHAVVDQPGAAVAVEEQRRVDAVDVEPRRIRPGAGRMRGGDHEVAHAAARAVEAGIGDVEAAPVVGERGGEQAAGQGFALDIGHLPGAVDGVADLPPRHQVGAVEQRQAGVIAEARSDQVEVPAHADRGRVGMEAGQHRVAALPGARHGPAVVAAVLDRGEPPAMAPGTSSRASRGGRLRRGRRCGRMGFPVIAALRRPASGAGARARADHARPGPRHVAARPPRTRPAPAHRR